MTHTNSLTAAVIKYLNLKGFEVWRSNNIAAPGRKFTGKLGLPDCIGYHRKTGRFIAVEIKTGKDKLSLDQISFGINALEGGAMWFCTRDIDNFRKQIDNAADGDFYMRVVIPTQIEFLKEDRNRILLHDRKRK